MMVGEYVGATEASWPEEGGDKDEASPRPRVRVIRPVVGLAKMEGHHIDNKPTHA